MPEMNGYTVPCIIAAAVIAVAAYLIGSISFSIILSKAVSGKDIRESGSGNAGATNMLRTHGKKMGVITLLLDALKGVAAISIAVAFTKLMQMVNLQYAEALQSISLIYIAGFFVILGHNFPVFFGFRGGKGVATSLGVVLMLDWKIGIILAVFAILIMTATRYVSLGSVSAAVMFMILQISRMFFDNSWNLIRIICVMLIGLLVIFRHRANIERLLNGTENKLGAKKDNEE